MKPDDAELERRIAAEVQRQVERNRFADLLVVSGFFALRLLFPPSQVQGW